MKIIFRPLTHGWWQSRRRKLRALPTSQIQINTVSLIYLDFHLEVTAYSAGQVYTRGVWEDPEFLKAYLEKSTSIAVEEGDKKTEQLNLIPLSAEDGGRD